MKTLAAAAIAVLALIPARAPAVDMLTYHNDNLRTGWNDAETVLTPASLRNGLKPLFVRTLDGVSYTQPLVATAVTTPHGARSLVIVGTDQDTVDAFDARTGEVVWSRSLVPAGESVVTPAFTGCPNMKHAGISGTPVIDRQNDRVDVVAESVSQGANAAIHFHIWGLALGTGAVRAVRDVQAVVPGEKRRIPFLGDYQQQRAALLLANGRVYAGFGSTCDFNGDKYHGWLFAYDAATLKPRETFMDSPYADKYGNYMGGIWMSGNGPATDANGNLMLVTGNGVFNERTGWGDSALKLAPDLSHVIDSFTPDTVASDNSSDADFGSGGIMLLPDLPGQPSIAFGQGKDGILTMLDQHHLGGYVPGGPDNVLGELSLGSTWSSPAYFASAGAEYVFATGGPLYAVKITRKPAQMKVVGRTGIYFRMDNGNGETPEISSNGDDVSSAIVWIVSYKSDATIALTAFAASDLSDMLVSKPLGDWQFHQTNSIQVPTVANGVVYVAGFEHLYAFVPEGK